MTAVSCPRCGASATGNFCASCGASLAALTCPSCGHTPAPGARFCNKCGTSLAGGEAPGAARAPAATAASGGDGHLAWWVAGATLVALILFVAWPVIRPGGAEQQPAAAAAPATSAGGGAPPDLSSMTPREAADRLFNRVMAAAEQGDDATVQQFLPMAIGAHDLARPLDADGLFHLNMLHRAGGDFASALAVAEEGLAAHPDHLLLIAGAGEAAEGMGDDAAARAHWRRFLDLYDAQRARRLEEYEVHVNILERSREHALELLGG